MLADSRTWSAVRAGSAALNRFRFVPTSQVPPGEPAFGIRDVRLHPLLVCEEAVGIAPDASPVPVGWADPLPLGRRLRVDLPVADRQVSIIEKRL